MIVPHHPSRRIAASGARDARAFTLVEVLAALMLMVIVLPVVMGGLGAATRAGSQAASRDVAAALAEAKLTEIVATRDFAVQTREAAFEPHFGAEAERYTWTLNVRDWNDAALRELTVEVRWHQHGRERVQRLVTVVAAQETAP